MDLRKHHASMHNGKPRRKRHEESFSEYLQTLGVPYQRELVIRFPISAQRRFARVDFFWRTGFGSIVFEIDEYAHHGSRYGIDYECQRMKFIHTELSTKFGGSIHIIRYNPHPIRDKPPATQEEREKAIQRTLAFNPSGSPLTITYLFYHTDDAGFPEIARQPEYTLKNHIRLDSPDEGQGATSM